MCGSPLIALSAEKAYARRARQRFARFSVMWANRDKLADMRRLIVVAALVAAPLLGSWQRYFMGGPSHTDQPTAQPLAYFQAHPCARNERTYRFDFCGGRMTP
jgi:hypothetical protein